MNNYSSCEYDMIVYKLLCSNSEGEDMEEAKELLSKVIVTLAEDIAKTIYGKAKGYFVDREKKSRLTSDMLMKNT